MSGTIATDASIDEGFNRSIATCINGARYPIMCLLRYVLRDRSDGMRFTKRCEMLR